jgi:hypothetical protein
LRASREETVSEADHAGDIRPEEPTDDRKLIDELIFRQYLDEVHLLMDFVSGRADRSLATLTMPNPAAPGETMTSGAIVKAISEMRYPPGPNSAVNAENAAILLMAKDRLSALADPARGLTIAYTTLFVAAEARRTFITAAWRRLLNGANRPARGHDTRVDLARRTFPGLAAHARKFRLWRDVLAWLTLPWLFFTAIAYWDAGLGRAALERLDQDWKATVTEVNNNPSLINCNDATDPGGGEVKPEELQRQSACRRYNYGMLLGKTAGEQVNDVFHCKQMSWSRIVHVWCWQWLLPGDAETAATAGKEAAPNPGEAAKSPNQVARYARANATYWQTATANLIVFTTYILPMMFALLGTLIGAFRAIMARIGAGELAPRDFVRMKSGIVTGLVAGIAVGLFLSPSSVPTQGAGGVAGQLTLTASGLGFLAGYASQSFFGYLDRVVSAVFPLTSPTVAAAPPSPVLVPVAGASARAGAAASGATGATGSSAAAGPTGATAGATGASGPTGS